MDNHVERLARGAEVELGRTRPPALPPVRAVDWQSVKRAHQERYQLDFRVDAGAVMALRARKGLGMLKDDIEASGHAPDDLDMLLLQSYAFGAAECIADYMRQR